VRTETEEPPPLSQIRERLCTSSLFIIAQLKESNQPGEGLIGLDLGAVFPSIKSNVASSDGGEWNGLS
jgi:hypothetical protein